MTKTKTTGLGTLFLVGTVLVGAGFFYGLIKPKLTDDRVGVTFSVMFTPRQNRSFVNIKIVVDGVTHTEDKTIRSPWSRLVLVSRGQTAVLTATQTVSDKLSCAVDGDVQERRDFPGSVVCTHKRVI